MKIHILQLDFSTKFEPPMGFDMGGGGGKKRAAPILILFFEIRILSHIFFFGDF